MFKILTHGKTYHMILEYLKSLKLCRSRFFMKIHGKFEKLQTCHRLIFWISSWKPWFKTYYLCKYVSVYVHIRTLSNVYLIIYYVKIITLVKKIKRFPESPCTLSHAKAIYFSKSFRRDRCIIIIIIAV